jgi:hypothetical protein
VYIVLCKNVFELAELGKRLPKHWPSGIILLICSDLCKLQCSIPKTMNVLSVYGPWWSAPHPFSSDICPVTTDHMSCTGRIILSYTSRLLPLPNHYFSPYHFLYAHFSLFFFWARSNFVFSTLPKYHLFFLGQLFAPFLAPHIPLCFSIDLIALRLFVENLYVHLIDLKLLDNLAG